MASSHSGSLPGRSDTRVMTVIMAGPLLIRHQCRPWSYPGCPERTPLRPVELADREFAGVHRDGAGAVVPDLEDDLGGVGEGEERVAPQELGATYTMDVTRVSVRL